MTFRSGYNDAYDTPGWTAQNFAYPPPLNTILNLPTDIEMVTISGHFRDGNGGLANGWFDLDNQGSILVHASTKEILTTIKFRAEVRDGTFSLTLPATDATTIAQENSQPWYYHMRLSLAGGQYIREFWNVSLPRATPAVDFYDITGTTSAPAGLPLVIIDGGSA